MTFKDRTNSQSMEVVVRQPVLFLTQSFALLEERKRRGYSGEGKGIDWKNLNRNISGNKPSLV